METNRGEKLMIQLRGRTALITGGTQGVGKAIAIALATAGADVVIHGYQLDDHSEVTRTACESHGVKVSLVDGDLSGPTMDSVSRLFERSIAVAPSIDILVNNAGTYIDKPFLEMDFETYEKTFRLNTASPYFLAQAFAKRWIANGVDGRMLFTGSINGLLSESDHTAYDSSKGAIHAMVRSLCVSLAPHGIRVNAMAPGLVRTPLTNRVLSSDNDFLKWMELHTPNGQVPEADVCGGAALFLVSDLAAHIHGQVLFVDGGMSIWQQPDLPAKLRGHLV